MTTTATKMLLLHCILRFFCYLKDISSCCRFCCCYFSINKKKFFIYLNNNDNNEKYFNK